MSAFIDLTPGTRIKVTPPGDPLGAAYECTVWTVAGEGLRLSPPRREAEALEVYEGERLSMFTTVHGRVYRFDAAVKRVEEDEEGFVIDAPRQAERSERRAFYRLQTRIQPRLVARLDDAGNEVQLLQATILDMSGGGVLLQTREFIPDGSRLRLVIPLEGDPVDLDMAALALGVHRPATSAQHFRVNCQFIEPRKSDTERIVRYVYRQQMELRKRGVI